jgi:starch synthase (maltosyl-transferring)
MTMQQSDGRSRVVIEGVRPQIDGGRFPIKRAIGERVVVEADIFTDGHDAVAAALRYRNAGDADWSEVSFAFLTNDRWQAEFTVTALGRAHYTIAAWVDRFGGWRRDMRARVKAQQDVAVDLQIGARLVEEAHANAAGDDAARLADAVARLSAGGEAAVALALSDELATLMARTLPRRFMTTYDRELAVIVDRERARFGAWYELFPRSTSPEPGRHGTFADCAERLPELSAMGFDIVYLPPIHPIGRVHRKGRNNAVTAQPDDPGSPWAIGAAEGGHDTIHPDLGTLEDFDRLVAAAREHGMEIAMDLALQCSPDHPWVKEHPEWFRHRPDGTIQYAENPPKKYQDIYPLDFETEDWQALWQEVKRVLLFWVERGVRTYRVDNPHTKPFPFWEWLLGEVQRDYPDTIFLSEAFTRPKVMYRLAKLGFNQSYTYFAWRNTKRELTDYFTELTQTPVREFYRPNLWPNTPDILTEFLQHGGRPAFIIRFVLAATLGAAYGIYGPAFELGEADPREPGSEEYLNSEKYELRRWQTERSDSLRDLIARVNRIRRDNPALQADHRLRFHQIDSDQMLAYTKDDEAGDNIVLTVVNLDPYGTHRGRLTLDLAALGLDPDHPYLAENLLTGATPLWHGPHADLSLDREMPVAIFRLRRRLRTEHDFDYFM